MPAFEVQRSIVINAPPEKVFDTVVDFGTWTTWSPWLCAEPEAEVTVSEDPSSVGSTYEWTGEIVGAGIIEHRQLEPGPLGAGGSELRAKLAVRPRPRSREDDKLT